MTLDNPNKLGHDLLYFYEEEHMTQEGLSMRKIEEILRLKWEKGLSNQAIAKSCRISPGSVSNYILRAKTARLSWPLPEDAAAGRPGSG